MGNLWLFGFVDMLALYMYCGCFGFLGFVRLFGGFIVALCAWFSVSCFGCCFLFTCDWLFVLGVGFVCSVLPCFVITLCFVG